MKNIIKRGNAHRAILAAIVMLALLFTACGRQTFEEKTDSISVQNAASDEELPWEIEETVLPDANLALTALVSQEETDIWELVRCIAKDTIIRVATVRGVDEEMTGTCIQKLERPYTEWENIYIKNTEWVENRKCYVSEAVIREDGRIYMLLAGVDDKENWEYYTVQWTEQNEYTIEEISGENVKDDVLSGSLLYVDGGDTFYFTTEENLQIFEHAFSEQKEWSHAEHIWQMAENTRGQVYLCGTSDTGAFCIWMLEDKKPLFVPEDVIADGSGRIGFRDEETGYLFTTYGIWQFDTNKGEIENIFVFNEHGYTLERVHGISVNESGVLQMIAEIDGENILLEFVQKTDTDASQLQSQDKIELELAVNFSSSYLKEAIVRYNRQSEKYKIVLRERADNEDITDFQMRVQAQLSGGGGPDILSDDVIDLQGFVEKNILRDLTDDFKEQQKNVLENVWSTGVVDGKSYAIPYSFYVITCVASADAVGERESWTTEEMMECVKQSGASVAIADESASELFSILVDGGNLIDWENGKCYFNTEEAIRTLEFAGAYGDERPGDTVGSRTAEGEILINRLAIPGLMFSRHMEALFHGREVYIGHPVERGKQGNVIVGDTLSVNHACEHPEGAIDFIQYLLSEEIQEKFAKEACDKGYDGFPACSDALEKMFAYSEEQAAYRDEVSLVANYRGYDFVEGPHSEEGLEKVRMLIESAQPQTERDDGIENIILEETPAYFSGDKSAQEVCDILQNRVQLYLDERQ